MACFVPVRRLRRLRESNGVQPHFNSHITYRRHCNACTILYPAMRRHVLPWDSSGSACPASPSYIHLSDPSHPWQQGSMPTDQTLALETLPRSNRHLLTSLSIFFSFGSVVAAVAAIFIIPSRSCSPPAATQSTLLNNLLECDVQKDNNGWKVLLFVLALIVRPLYIALTNTRFHSLPVLSVLNIYDLLRHWSCSSAVSSSSDCTNLRGGLYMQAGKKTLWRRSHKLPNTTDKSLVLPLKTCTTKVKLRRLSDEKSQPPDNRWNGRSSQAPLHLMEPRIQLRTYLSTLARITDISARIRALAGAHRPTRATRHIARMETTPTSRIKRLRTSPAGFGDLWGTG
jgi:hypothetical protein